MKTLSLDIETFSGIDLGKSSVYRYVESPDFTILLLGFSVSQAKNRDTLETCFIPLIIDDYLGKHAGYCQVEQILF